jgi:hypothetical protein
VQEEEDQKYLQKQSEIKKSPKVISGGDKSAAEFSVLKSNLKKAFISKVEEILIDLVQNNEKPGNFLPRPEPKKKTKKSRHNRNNTVQG